ncbi:MAG: hypothetical protein OXN90_13295 [Gemmatimonadota bacterium]|nr:hypothetical protein [Gemmatimonadota bacterium]
MNRAEFESKLSDYVRGELSAAEAQQIETYLTEHPEATDDLEAVRTVLELSADIGTSEPSDALFAAARANALEAIRAEDERKTQRAGFWQRRPRPVYLSGLAAMLAGIVFGVLWHDASTPAWAEVVAEVRKLHSVHIVGWFRGEKGERVPVKQWLKAPHFFRAEVDTSAARRVLVVSDEILFYADGVWYGTDIPGEEWWSIDEVADQLALPEREQLEPWSYQIERENLGQTVLFSIWRRSSVGIKTPSDIRFEIEVDAQTRLPSHARVYLDLGQEDWELVSELNYLDYNAPLADELFTVAVDTLQPFRPLEYESHPFDDVPLDPFVPWNRMFYMPLDGMDIAVYSPPTDRSVPDESMSYKSEGWIIRYEFVHKPLTEIVQSLGNRPVETPDSVLAERRYSVRIVHNQDIGPIERVKRLGRRFGFITSIEERQSIRTRWVFTQDGSEFPISVEEPQSGGYRISGNNVQGMGYLRDAIRNILTNAALNDLVKGYNQDLDEIEMQWDGAAADNPFERQVDVDVDFSDGWDVALDYLREHFGVTMERVSEPITYEVLVMHPHGERAK